MYLCLNIDKLCLNSLDELFVMKVFIETYLLLMSHINKLRGKHGSRAS